MIKISSKITFNMTPNQILDQEIINIDSIEAKSLDETELLKSFALFIKSEGSIRNSIERLDLMTTYTNDIFKKPGKLSELINKHQQSNLDNKHEQIQYSGC